MTSSTFCQAIKDPRIEQVKEIIQEEMEAVAEGNFVEIVVFKIDREGRGHWSWSQSDSLSRTVGLMETTKFEMMHRMSGE